MHAGPEGGRGLGPAERHQAETTAPRSSKEPAQVGTVPRAAVLLSHGSRWGRVGFAAMNLVSGVNSQLPPPRPWPPLRVNTKQPGSQAAHQMTFMLL